MSDSIVLYFPFDTLITDLENNKAIENNYRSICAIESSLTQSRPDFDEVKGSYINIAAQDKVAFNLNLLPFKSSSCIMINFFFNYRRKEKNRTLQVLAINEKSAFSIIKGNGISESKRNGLSFCTKTIINELGKLNILENSWFNCTIILNESGARLYIDNKLIAEAPDVIDELRHMVIGNNNDGDHLKISDLYIRSFSSVPEAEGAIENYLTKGLQDTGSKKNYSDAIDFEIYTHEATKELIVEDLFSSLKLKINFNGLSLLPDGATRFVLRFKKGYFKQYTEHTGTNDITINESDSTFEIIIPYSQARMGYGNNTLLIDIPNVVFVNLADQNQLFTQLEIFSIPIKQHHFEAEQSSLMIDATFKITDNRGLDECPFDLFVLGNNTLNNVSDMEQSITLRLSNRLNNTVDLVKGKTTFSIVSNYMFLLNEKDGFQAMVLNSDTLTTIPDNTDKNNSIALKCTLVEDAALNPFNPATQFKKLPEDSEEREENVLGIGSFLHDEALQKEYPLATNKIKECFMDILYRLDEAAAYYSLDVQPKSWDTSASIAEFMEQIGEKLNVCFEEIAMPFSKSEEEGEEIEEIIERSIRSWSPLLRRMSEIEITSGDFDAFVANFQAAIKKLVITYFIEDRITFQQIIETVLNDFKEILMNTIPFFSGNTSHDYIDLNIHDINATIGTAASGEYPFYLEYKNVAGYRNGRIPFILKTGRVFYT